MENRSFPRWMAPVIGIGAGVMVSLKGIRREGELDWRILVAGVGIGLMAGLVMWIIDAPSPKTGKPPTIIGACLAILGWLVVLIPLLNVAVSGLAFFINRNVKGWPNQVSRGAFGVGTLLSIVVVSLFIFY